MNTPLCFTANTAGSTITCPQAFEISTNGTTWTTASTSTAITLTNAGDKLYVRNGSVGTPTSNLGTFEMTGSIAASGNIMSLVDNTCTSTTIPCSECFYYLFGDCTSLTTAPLLPATTLTTYCYYQMFAGCTSLTKAPALPAVTLTEACYASMFTGCESLTTVPALPATTLGDSCYYNMFGYCTSLYVSDSSESTCTAAWRIPSSGVFTNTYTQSDMFYGCLGTRTTDEMEGEQGESYTYYTQNGPIPGYTKVYAYSQEPIEISTDAGMAAVLTDDNNFGKLYKFTGTTGAYTNGSIYVVKRIAPVITGRVGGRIFYVNSSASGATYTFYDKEYKELTTQTVEGLTDAYYYYVSGTGSADKFYVYDDTSHTYTYDGGTVSITDGVSSQSFYWGYYNTLIGATASSIGSGKTNTNTVLASGVPADYTPSIWGYIQDCRNNSLNDCDDWFIGSTSEYLELRSSGFVSFGSRYFWSSVESTSAQAYYWFPYASLWNPYTKAFRCCCVGMRSF